MTSPITPTPITALPPAPLPTDSAEVFDQRSFAFVEAQVAMVPQVNTAATQTNQNAVAAKEGADASASSASASASSATASAGSATTAADQVALAVAAKDSAEAAAAAAGAAAGLPSLVGNANKALTVLPDETGVGWSVLNARGSQDYTASATINKSMFGTASFVLVELWGGGASGSCQGGSSAVDASGGEGGSYTSKVVSVASLPASTSLVIGAGGAAVVHTASGTASAALGNAGGNSSFGSITAVGGLGTISGFFSTSVMNSIRGSNGGYSGGTGSATLINSSPFTAGGGGAVYGGGGGGAGSATAGLRTAGASFMAGSGGAGATSTASPVTAASGQIPSGGGGGVRLQAASGTCTSGAGARGQARLTWW